MKTVILCGGKGTRLREETEYRPKPMVPIGNRPILWHIMKRYALFGHKDFVLCLGYKGDVIKDYFRNYRWNSHDVTVWLNRPECHNALTAWRVRKVRSHVGKGAFFLTYGDGVGNIDLKKLLAFHRKSGAVCTLTAVHPPGRFGEVGLRPDGLVDSFNEKTQTKTGYINGGFMVCEPEFFDYLPDNPATMLEDVPLRQLAAFLRDDPAVRDLTLNRHVCHGNIMLLKLI